MNNNTFNQLVQTKYGQMLVNKNDTFIGKSLIKYGQISSDESLLYEQICTDGDVVVEAGANIGTHSLAISKAIGDTGKLYCYEPQRIVFQTLNANLALNSLTNTTTYQAGVGEKESFVNIPEFDYNHNGNYGGISITNYQEGTKTKVYSIDSHLNLQQLKLLKIDVEGMEIDVIKGAKQTIERLRPIIYCENDRRELSSTLIELLWSLSYDLYWHLPPLFNTENFNKDNENIFKNLVSVNMLCIPKESTLVIQNFKKITSSTEFPLKK